MTRRWMKFIVYLAEKVEGVVDVMTLSSMKAHKTVCMLLLRSRSNPNCILVWFTRYKFDNILNYLILFFIPVKC